MVGDELWRPAQDAEAVRRLAAHAESVDAGRFDLPSVPGDWDTGMLRAVTDTGYLTGLIPPRRGPVQGPAIRAGRSPAGDLWRPSPVETAPPTGTTEPAAAGRGRRTRGGSPAVLALVTMTSRVSGLTSQLVQVAALGSSLLATTFTIGNTLPNMVYFLLIGGALNAVFVPQLVRAMHRDPDGGAAYTDRLLSLVLTVLLLVTVAAVAAAPLIVDVSAGDLGSADRRLTIAFARYCLPQIFFYGLFATAGQILNARDRFGPTAWAPILNNLVVIAVFTGFLLVGGTHGRQTLGSGQSLFLGLGTTAGVVVQALIVVVSLRRAGVRFRPRFDVRGVGLGETGSLAKWTLAYMLVGQSVNVLVMRLASAVDQAQADGHHLHAGVGYAAYSKALLVWILPQSVITVSLLTALLPRMSRAAAADDSSAVRDDLSFGLRMSGVVIVPAAFAFLALGPQLAVLLFRHGATELGEARGIGFMLTAFGLGLIPFSAQYVILRGFYAFGDTRTPFLIGVVTGAANAAIAVAAHGLLGGTRWPVVAMAAGYGVSSAIGLGYAARRLRRRLSPRAALPGRTVKRTYLRLVSAGALAAVVAFATAQEATAAAGPAVGGSLLAVTGGGAVLVGIFVLMAKALRVTEVDVVAGALRARLGR